jgi:hypothetical protein
MLNKTGINFPARIGLPCHKLPTFLALQEKQNLSSAFIIFFGPRKSQRKLRNFCRPEPADGT